MASPTQSIRNINEDFFGATSNVIQALDNKKNPHFIPLKACFALFAT